MLRLTALVSMLFCSAALFSCGSSNSGEDPRGPASMCDPARDDDNDCMSNGLEGCGLDPEPDSDGDGSPDWADLDSDDDKVPDRVDSGSCSAFVDSDSDGKPDHLDDDADNDGLMDGQEDRNGDGKIGSCDKPCVGPLDCQGNPLEACAIGVKGGSVCVSPACLHGETSPTKNDTDSDDTLDAQEGHYICNPQTAENPHGLKRIRYIDATETAYRRANWRAAIEVGALDATPIIDNPLDSESAYIFDMTSPAVELAGFLATRPAPGDSTAVLQMNAAVAALQAVPDLSAVVVRISGSNGTSLDGFETVLKTVLEIHTGTERDVTDIRKVVLPALLGRAAEDVTIMPPPWEGKPSQRFVLTMQTIYRKAGEQVLYMGSVARGDMYEDRTKATGFHADDLSNGTGFSQSGNQELVECEQFLAEEEAAADIIWVIDESGSTSDDRQRITQNAELFFQKVVDAGLDFRMGVTTMDKNGPSGSNPGQFSTRQEGGTGDRWILPTEPDAFRTAINKPSGPDFAAGDESGLTAAKASIDLHTPRDNFNPQKVREGVKLVVMYVTDEHAQEVEDEGILGDFNDAVPTVEQLAEVQALVVPFVEHLQSHDAIAHVIGEPLPHTTAPPCSGSEHTYGYYEVMNALGGQLGSICQPNLDPTLDAIIDSIVGDASPIRLSFVPISASIAVTRDNKVIKRSRDRGWDFRSSANSVVFFNLPFDPANPSDTIVSYRRWAVQIPVE